MGEAVPAGTGCKRVDQPFDERHAEIDGDRQNTQHDEGGEQAGGVTRLGLYGEPLY